jgi:hypothetical protein
LITARQPADLRRCRKLPGNTLTVQIWWFGVRMVPEQLGGPDFKPEHAAKLAINAPAQMRGTWG